MDESKKILVWLVGTTVLVTIIGLGLSAYNYYVFDNPFFTNSLQKLLFSFVISLTITLPVLLEKRDK